MLTTEAQKRANEKYRKNNPEKFKKALRKSIKKYNEKIKTSENYEEILKKRAEYFRNYYSKNSDKIIERVKKYQAKKKVEAQPQTIEENISQNMEL